jgi:hypothetical protein
MNTYGLVSNYLLRQAIKTTVCQIRIAILVIEIQVEKIEAHQDQLVLLLGIEIPGLRLTRFHYR